jgi:integrase
VHRHLIPGIGAHRTDRLQPEHIEKLYAAMRAKKLKPGTVHHAHRTLRAALNEAVRRGQIVKNPVLVAKPPRLVEEEIEPFTVPEAQRILAATTIRRNGVRYAIALAIGLRQGEALGLQWRDVNEGAGTLTVRRALQRHTWQHGCGGTCRRKRGADCPERHSGGLAIVETKSRAGRRTVGVPSHLMDALTAHRARQDEERDTAGELWHDGGWVFAQPNGKPTDPRADYEDWRTLLRDAGVRPARLHDARHTAATMLLVLKVPTRAVMDVMGWSNASMTGRYQHVPAEVLTSIAEQVGGLLWSPENTGAEG